MEVDALNLLHSHDCFDVRYMIYNRPIKLLSDISRLMPGNDMCRYVDFHHFIHPSLIALTFCLPLKLCVFFLNQFIQIFDVFLAHSLIITP